MPRKTSQGLPINAIQKSVVKAQYNNLTGH